MTDLAEWLLAQIADDEAAARDWDSDGRARIAVMWTGPEPGYTTAAIDHADDVWVADGREVVDPRHVTIMYDPARVLADCAAKRKLMEHCELTLRIVEPWQGSRSAAGIAAAAIDQVQVTLRLLAQPYADRPGWNPAWKVET